MSNSTLESQQVPSQQTVDGVETRHLRRGIEHDIQAAVGRQKAQLGEEQNLQQESYPEDGHRDPAQGDSTAGVIKETVLLESGDDPQR